MARKAFDRVNHRKDRAAAVTWAQDRAEDLATFCANLDAELWQETIDFASRFERTSTAELRALGLDLGGGGAYPLMYFLTRHLRPSVVVETGVAAGWTSASILTALEVNESGTLYSSDFPYFRLPSPERFVGYLVPEQMKDRWHLSILGDRRSLPEFARVVDRIDLVHYDSDKTAAGRRFAMRCLSDKLAPDAVVVMDDIQDNLFFRDWVTNHHSKVRVFGFEGKFLGLTEGF